MYLLVVFLPLIGSLLTGFFGFKIGKFGASILPTSLVFISFLISTFIFYEVGLSGSPCYIDLFTWIQSGTFNVTWGFMFDSLTAIMLIVVTSVSTLVHLYSTEYMSEDPHLPRFMSYISAFTFFMLILITGDNFIQMFLGWEGVGLCSYLLINFWFTRVEANKAAIKAMLVNKIGDVGLLLGIIAVYFSLQSVDFSTVFATSYTLQDKGIYFLGGQYYILDVICFLLFIGCIGKSAQIGLHTWLPDAMEGPTPVSALIHAATMVTAGVFMLLRCSPLFEYSPNVLYYVTIFGALTAFFAATTGLVQNDLKKVIAYSTCSQLGYMVFACGISSYNVSIFHLANHAFFKALLFLGAGSVIHALSDEQDMRRMGGLVNLLPLTYTMMLIGSLSLMGFPYLTGFYSKDVILELAYAKYTFSGHFAHWLGCISAFFTSFYSIRLLYLTFINKTSIPKKVMLGVHEAPVRMYIPLIVLGFGSVFIGYLTKDMIIGLGTDFFNNSIFILPKNTILIDSEFIPHWIKVIPVVFSISGAILSYYLYSNKKEALISYSKKYIVLYTFLSKKYNFDTIYNSLFVQPLLSFGYNVSFKVIDRGLIEVLGPYGLTHVFHSFSRKISSLQTGFVFNYAFTMLLGLVMFTTYLLSYDVVSSYIDTTLFIVLLYTYLVYNNSSKIIKK